MRPKHASQWQNTLSAYAYPVIADLPVASIDTALTLKVLEPIWTTKTETAKRLQGRMENIVDWATARGYRSGENPTRWRGHLDKLLPAPSKVRKVEHFAALPYADLPTFFKDLAKQEGVAARALAFTIFTASRTGEVRGIRWGEIDGDTWTIPAERMKSGREHRVPLSSEARAIISEMRVDAVDLNDDFVFPGGRRGKPLSDMALAAVLKRMNRTNITVHGFRSTFRAWCREVTNFPREVAEAALAHVLGDKTEAAYARGDMLTKRAKLMDAWAHYCTTPRVESGVVQALARHG